MELMRFGGWIRQLVGDASLFVGFIMVIRRRIRSGLDAVSLKVMVSFGLVSFFIQWRILIFIIINALFMIFITTLCFFATFIITNEPFTTRLFTFLRGFGFFTLKFFFTITFLTLPSLIDYFEGFYSY